MAATTTLVILGSSITALAVARDARRHGLRPVVVDHGNGIALHSRGVTALRVSGPHDAGSLAGVLRHAGPGAALVATADAWLRFVVAQRRALDAAFGLVLHPRNAMLEVCLEKDRFGRWCGEHGLPTPTFWLPCAGGGPPATLRFPLLLRPSRTLHGAGPALPKAVEVDDEAGLLHWLARYRQAGSEPVVSESLLGQRLTQYSVPFARSAAGTLLFVARKLRPQARRCAQGSLVEWRPELRPTEVLQLAQRAIECAEGHGIGEVEILHAQDTQQLHLIEINARPWLQYALAPASGHDLLGWMLQAAAGPAPAARPARPCTWINLRDDRFQSFSAAAGTARHERPRLLNYLRSIARSNVFAVFDASDPVPFIRTLLRRA